MTTTPSVSRHSGHRTAGWPQRVWEPASGAAVRGTVVALPGQGRTPAVFDRLGRRLAFDDYRVVAVAPDAPQPVDATLAGVRDLVAGQPGPVVLLGCDTGALLAVRAAQRHPRVAGVVLIGLPGPGLQHLATPGAEGDAPDSALSPRRHAEHDVDHAGAGEPGGATVPAGLALTGADRVDVPALVLHGDSDPDSPPFGSRVLVSRWPHARLVVVAGSGHHVLEDHQHRSVAAEVLQFLERVRSGALDQPLLRPSLRSTF